MKEDENKSLLELDDVWNESQHDWNELKLHFRFACPWCKVIITTRSKTISSIIILNSDVMCFDILFDDHCWGLIKHSLRENLEQHEDLKEIGVNFAKKCKGLLLAAN